MLYLLEVTYTDKESQALYDTYTDEIALMGAVETKLGQAMKAEAMKAELLVAFDSMGKILAQQFHTKDDSIKLSNRLVWITTNSNGESANMQKYDTALEAEANYHLKHGSAMGNTDVNAILAMVVEGSFVTLNEYWARPVEPVEPQPEEEPQE